MSQSMSHNPPFLSNSLRMPDEEGLYLFLVDTLVVPSGHHGEVRKHEVGHRVLSHVSMGNSTFGVIRELVGMSHTLLWLLLDLAFQNNVSIRGKKLGDLQVSGGTPQARSDIEALLRRVEYVENIIDMGWRGLAPIAEFAAIDFSEGVQDDEKNWFLWRKSPFPDLVPDLEHKYDKEKDRLVKTVMSPYPTDFGGYHMRFGSFQKALWKAWSEYQKISDDGARKELLRLCMSLLYLDNNEIYVMDPIQVILDRASFAQQHGGEARNAFFAERQMIGLKAIELISSIEAQVLADIHDEIQVIRDLTLLLSDLVQKQFEQEEDKFLDTPFGPRQVVIDSPLQEDTGAGHSFLRFEWNAQGEAKVYINPFFLSFELGSQGRPFPKDWWRTLILIEKIRDALKSGQPIACPFKGWKLECKDEQEEVRCGNECFIRQWIDVRGRRIGLVRNEGACTFSN